MNFHNPVGSTSPVPIFSFLSFQKLFHPRLLKPSFAEEIVGYFDKQIRNCRQIDCCQAYFCCVYLSALCLKCAEFIIIININFITIPFQDGFLFSQEIELLYL